MKIGKRTAKLLREAIVLAHVEGVGWGQTHGRDEPYPQDSAVVVRVLTSAVRNGDIYPTLSTLDVALEADEESRQESLDFLRVIMADRKKADEQ